MTVNHSGRPHRSRTGPALRVIVGLALFAYILLKLEIGALIDELISVAVVWVLVNLLIEIITRVIVTWKWFLLLKEKDPSARFRDALAAQFIGVSIGSVVPLAGMDLTIGYTYFRQSGRAATAVSSVLLDRLVTMYAAVAFSAVVLVWHRSHFSTQPEVIHLMGSLTLGALLIPLALVIAVQLAGDRMLAVLPARVAATASSSVNEMLKSLADGSQALIANVLLSLVVQALRVAAVVTLAFAVGLEPDLTDYALISPLVFLFLFAWIGWEQGVFVVLLGLIGVPAETAFAMSIINRLVFSVSMLPGIACVLTGWGIHRRTPRATTAS